MSRRYFLAALIVLSLTLAPLLTTPRVQSNGCAGTICWANPGTSGNWEDPTKWNLGRVPTASDDVVLPFLAPDSFSYTVTMSSVQTVNSILVDFDAILECSSACTLTIKSHTPITITLDTIGGGLIGVGGFTPAVTDGSADIYGELNIAGNVVNNASLVDAGGLAGSIHILAGGTFVNFNSLDVTNGFLQNDGVFVKKCRSLLTPTPELDSSHFEGSGTYLTESPCPTQVSTAPGSSVSGTASFNSNLGGFTSLTSTAVSSVSPAPPAGLTFPAGLFSFTISGLRAGATVTVTITLPSELPAGPFSYWKFQSGAWTQFPSASLDSTRTIITLIFTASPSGTVIDPGGPAFPSPTIVPEYPLGLPLLAIFMIIAYGLIKRRTRIPENT
jgi:hypothetical protein